MSKLRVITADEVIAHVRAHPGMYRTVAQRIPFGVTPWRDGIKFSINKNTRHEGCPHSRLQRYVKVFNRERSYETRPYKRFFLKSYFLGLVHHLLSNEQTKPRSIMSEPVNRSQATSDATRKWTRDELLIALNLYHKMNFGQFTSSNPVIVAVANKLGRKPGSLSMKLCNFASFDPALKMRGIKGLSGASKLDKIIWTEFHENLSAAAPASEQAFQKLFGPEEGNGVEVIPKKGVRLRRQPSGSTDRWLNAKQRRGQDYFRDAVLNNFGGCCGITGLAVRELLIASHILPWGKYEAERLNVRNGLALSRLHDAAFDIGLITFDSSLRLELSKELKSHLPQRTVAECFAAYEGQPLRLPEDAALPEERFLAVHRAKSLEKWA